MSAMFCGAASFAGDISGWHTGNVKDMQNMFNGAESFDCDLAGWETGSVTNMQGLFCLAK